MTQIVNGIVWTFSAARGDTIGRWLSATGNGGPGGSGVVTGDQWAYFVAHAADYAPPPPVSIYTPPAAAPSPALSVPSLADLTPAAPPPETAAAAAPLTDLAAALVAASAPQPSAFEAANIAADAQLDALTPKTKAPAADPAAMLAGYALAAALVYFLLRRL